MKKQYIRPRLVPIHLTTNLLAGSSTYTDIGGKTDDFDAKRSGSVFSIYEDEEDCSEY